MSWSSCLADYARSKNPILLMAKRNLTLLFLTFIGWTGLFCPCVLFGRNIEILREDTPWTTPCICHAVCIEGGMAVAAAIAVIHGIEPRTSFLICEGLLFAWWMCGIYTGLVRQSLQKKYHLKVTWDFCIWKVTVWRRSSMLLFFFPVVESWLIYKI